MVERATKELFNEIKHASEADQFMTNMATSFIRTNPAEYLAELIQIKHVTKSQVIRRANLTPSIGYQYFDGKRRPNRARIIALGFGFQLTLTELNTMSSELVTPSFMLRMNGMLWSSSHLVSALILIVLMNYFINTV